MQDFSDFVLPSLVPVFMTASGQALFQLMKFVDVLYTVMNPTAVSDVLIPLMCRGADHGDSRTPPPTLPLHEAANNNTPCVPARQNNLICFVWALCYELELLKR